MTSRFEPYPTSTADDLRALPKEETIRDFYEIARTRRNVLGGIGIAAAVLMLGLKKDSEYAERHYPRRNLEINMVKSSIDVPARDHTTIFVPPFNFISAEPFAEAVQDTAAQFGNVAALSHDSTGFSIDTCEEKIRQFIEANNVNTLTLCGSSVGGLISTVLAGRIPEVNHLIIDSGPSNIGNVKDLPSLLPPRLAAVADQLGLTGGPVTRGAVEFYQRIEAGDKDIRECLAEAIAQMDSSKCPNGVDVDLFWFLATHDALVQGSRIDRKIDIDYLGAADPRSDTLVDQDASAADYEKLAEAIHGHFSRRGSKETGHSDIPHHAQAYERMMLGVFSERAVRRQSSNATAARPLSALDRYE